MNDYTSKLKAYNNVFYNNDYAISSTYGELELYNNIFNLKKAGSVAISKDRDPLISNNNVFYPVEGGFIENQNQMYFSLQEYSDATGQDSKSSDKDPLFEEEYNDNFKLKSSSPCIDAGIFLGLTEDKFGIKVPSGNEPDIGIAEYMGDNTVSSLFKLNSQDNDNTYVYPNPNNGNFNIKLPEAEQVEKVKIFDNLGRKVWENSTLKQLLSVQLNLISGEYYVNIITLDNQITEKIIIQ
jgi:hypothetical protein